MLDGVPVRRGQHSHAHREDGVAGVDADVVGVLALTRQMSPFFQVKLARWTLLGWPSIRDAFTLATRFEVG